MPPDVSTVHSHDLDASLQMAAGMLLALSKEPLDAAGRAASVVAFLGYAFKSGVINGNMVDSYSVHNIATQTCEYYGHINLFDWRRK